MSATTEDAIAALEDVCCGRASVTYPEEPESFWSGDLAFTLSNGWTVVVFLDCGDWDYIDHVVAPDGTTFDCCETKNPEHADQWHPLFFWQPHNEMVRPLGDTHGGAECNHWGRWQPGTFRPVVAR